MGNRFDSHIVMRRSDTTSGEDVVKGAREHYDVTGNHLDLIRDHHNTPHIHPQGTEFLAYIRRIRVNDFPGQDLITDDYNASCLCHSLSALFWTSGWVPSCGLQSLP